MDLMRPLQETLARTIPRGALFNFCNRSICGALFRRGSMLLLRRLRIIFSGVGGRCD